jgi:hypothetical protein
MPVVNATIAAIFDEIADLLDIQGANSFRVRAYRNAARTIGSLATDIKPIAADPKELKELPGIGDDLAAKIGEIVESGRCEFLERLRKQVPPAVAELLKVPGLGPKRVRTLYQELEVQTLDQSCARRATGGSASSAASVRGSRAGLWRRRRRNSGRPVDSSWWSQGNTPSRWLRICARRPGCGKSWSPAAFAACARRSETWMSWRLRATRRR